MKSVSEIVEDGLAHSAIAHSYGELDPNCEECIRLVDAALKAGNQSPHDVKKKNNGRSEHIDKILTTIIARREDDAWS